MECCWEDWVNNPPPAPPPPAGAAVPPRRKKEVGSGGRPSTAAPPLVDRALALRAGGRPDAGKGGGWDEVTVVVVVA